MRKRDYLNKLLELLSADEIRRSALNPTPYMSKTHIKLHWIALRRLGADHA